MGDRSIALAAGLPRRAEPLEQVVADAQRVGHRRQRRVHRARGGEEARVDDVEVVEVVRLAVDVERRGRRDRCRSARCRTGARCRRAGSAGLSTDQRGISVRRQPSGPSRPLSLASSRLCGSVLWSVLARWMCPLAVDRDAVARVRAGPRWSARSRSRAWRCSRARARARTTARRRAGCRGRLAEHLDVPERELGVVGAPVVVVEAERLLEPGRRSASREIAITAELRWAM